MPFRTALLPSLLFVLLVDVWFTTAPYGAPPQGKETLPLLEGRWSDGDCRQSYWEFSFSGVKLLMNWGPQNAGEKMSVDVTYDGIGRIVLYFPSLHFRSTVRWKTNDMFETDDIDAHGKASTSSYRRCRL